VSQYLPCLDDLLIAIDEESLFKQFRDRVAHWRWFVRTRARSDDSDEVAKGARDMELVFFSPGRGLRSPTLLSAFHPRPSGPHRDPARRISRRGDIFRNRGTTAPPENDLGGLRRWPRFDC
jgi:hypothetical protein